MEALGIDLRIIIAYLINFIILIIGLRAFAYRPILGLLERRRTEIAEGLAAADRVKSEAEAERAKLQADVETARMSSQDEAKRIAQATADMRENILAEARKEAEEIKEKARADIAGEREAMQAEMRRQLADLTVQLTRKVVGQSIDESSQREMIGQFLTELGD